MLSHGVKHLCQVSCKYVKRFKVIERTRKIVNTEREITPNVGKPELRFMYSARRFMVFNICVKDHDNMSSGFKVMKRTRKLLTHKGQ